MKRAIAAVSALLLCTTALFAQRSLGDFHRGADSLVYTGYAPLAHKPVTIYYYIPTTGDVRRMPVLIAFHGAEREGKNPRNNWMDFAERDGFVVICPEFSRALYNENEYQFGNVFKDRKSQELNPEEVWTYSIVEPIFDYFKEQTGSKAKTYCIQGHSAGGQFTHRYLLAKPDARVDAAVASNPGSWTWISDDGTIRGSEDVFTWPYTTYGTPFGDDRHIRAYLGRNLTVHVGDSDTLTSGRHVPTDKASLTEGRHRYERGLNYYDDMQAYARKKGLRFGWGQKTVGGVGHRGAGMIYAASYRDENGVRRYDVNKTRKTGAYEILFGNNY